MKSYSIANEKEIMIINADDLGYNHHIDRGILELLLNGQLKSASLMVNGNNIQQVI